MLGHDVDCFGMTDVGKVRESNQDQFLIADLHRSMRVHHTSLGLDYQTRLFGGSQGKLFLVADGMGGHAAGERASSLAVDCVAEYLLNTTHCLFRVHDDDADDKAFCDDLKSAFDHCQAKFTAEVEAMPNRKGMGTTLTIAYVVWPRLYVVHVGDSRVYLLRRSKLEQITRDHTLAQEFVDTGHMNKSVAEVSRLSHVLWNAVGGTTDGVTPEIHKAELQITDKLLLCSDGLTRHVPDAQLCRKLQQDKSAMEICEVLNNAANQAGGSDNITVIVAQFRDTPQEQQASLQEFRDASISEGKEGTNAIAPATKVTQKTA